MPKRRTTAERLALKAKRQAAAEQRRATIAQQARTRMEVVAEEMAPAAQRCAVISSDGEVIRDALADPDVRRGGYRRADALRRMHNQNSHQITSRHLAAVDRFSTDFEVGLCGASAGGDVGVFVSGGGQVGLSERQLISATRYRHACDAMDRYRWIVQGMGLHQWTLTKCMLVAGVGRPRALQDLVAGADKLAEFYMPSRADRPVRVPSDVVDPAVTDIGQDRIGRFARA